MFGVSSSTLLLAAASAAVVNAITVNVSGTASHPIPRTLCEFGDSLFNHGRL